MHLCLIEAKAKNKKNINITGTVWAHSTISLRSQTAVICHGKFVSINKSDGRRAAYRSRCITHETKKMDFNF